MSRLYEYAIIFSPRRERDAAGNDITLEPEILVDVTRIMARDDKEVGIRAGRAIPDSYMDKLDEVEILVRPFA